MIKAGMKVTVYEDPVTEKKPEGEAIIVRVLKRGLAEGFSWCKVRFPKDSDPRATYDRWIKEPKGGS